MQSALFYLIGRDPCDIFSEKPFGGPISKLDQLCVGEGGISTVYANDTLAVKVTKVTGPHGLRNFFRERKPVSVDYMEDSLLVEDQQVQLTDDDRLFLRVAVSDAAILSKSNQHGIPHIPAYFGHCFGVIEGDLFSATTMTRAQGEQVNHRLKVEDIGNVLRDVSEHLGIAPVAGLMHGDIRPRNVLYHKDSGVTTIIDNGMSQMFPDELDHPERDIIVPQFETTSTDMPAYPSATGLTKVYASPEHAKGKAVGPSSDWFSFGLFAMNILTGKDPQRVMLERTHDNISGMDINDFTKAAWDQRASYDGNDWEHLLDSMMHSGMEPDVVHAIAHLTKPQARYRDLGPMAKVAEELGDGRNPFRTKQLRFDLLNMIDDEEQYTTIDRQVTVKSIRSIQDQRRATTRMKLEGKFTRSQPIIEQILYNSELPTVLVESMATA